MNDSVQWALLMSSKLIDFLRTGLCSDVLVLCNEEGEGVHAHKVILSLASQTLQSTMVQVQAEGVSQVALQHLSQEPRAAVYEILAALYTGRITMTRQNYQLVFKFSKHYQVEWLWDVAVRWVRDSITQTFSLDFVKFACELVDRFQDRTLLKLIDHYNDHYASLTFKRGDKFIGFKNAVVRKFLKFSHFDSPQTRVLLTLEWLESEPTQVKDVLSTLMQETEFLAILETDSDAFHAIKDKLATLCPEDFEALITQKIEGALAHAYLKKLKCRNIDEETLATTDVKIMKYLLSYHAHTSAAPARGLGGQDEEELLGCKVGFLIKWLQYGNNKDHLEELEKEINEEIDLPKLYGWDGNLFSEFVESTCSQDTARISEKFAETMTTCKKLLKLASTDRWAQFALEEVTTMIAQLEDQLDSYSIIGAFSAWVAGDTARKTKSSWSSLFKSIMSHRTSPLSPVLQSFVEDMVNSSDPETEEYKKTLLELVPLSKEEEEVFFAGSLPHEDSAALAPGEGMCTIKRQAGEFTKGSRIMTFRSTSGDNSRLIRVGFDNSRTPALFKYQTSLGRGRKASMIDEKAEDVTHKFATLYGTFNGEFVNLPFTHPMKLEELIGRARQAGQEFRIVVVAKH